MRDMSSNIAWVQVPHIVMEFLDSGQPGVDGVT